MKMWVRCCYFSTEDSGGTKGYEDNEFQWSSSVLVLLELSLSVDSPPCYVREITANVQGLRRRFVHAVVVVISVEGRDVKHEMIRICLRRLGKILNQGYKLLQCGLCVSVSALEPDQQMTKSEHTVFKAVSSFAMPPTTNQQQSHEGGHCGTLAGPVRSLVGG